MPTAARLVPLLAQYDHAAERLLNRLHGPWMDSGDGTPVEVPPLTDDEYVWSPAPGPLPVATIAWRLHHLRGLLLGRADWSIGSRSFDRSQLAVSPDAAAAIHDLAAAVTEWRKALVSADDAVLDTVGYSAFPDGSDVEEPFWEIVWWMNQELLHHGAEVALLRDLYGAAALSAAA